MILPSKHLSLDRALLTVGARILLNLSQPKTISAVWEELLCQGEKTRYSTSPLKYDQFVLALDLLFLMRAVELADGLLKREVSL
jgi:hypothetical protein